MEVVWPYAQLSNCPTSTLADSASFGKVTHKDARDSTHTANPAQSCKARNGQGLGRVTST